MVGSVILVMRAVNRELHCHWRTQTYLLHKFALYVHLRLAWTLFILLFRPSTHIRIGIWQANERSKKKMLARHSKLVCNSCFFVICVLLVSSVFVAVLFGCMVLWGFLFWFFMLPDGRRLAWYTTFWLLNVSGEHRSHSWASESHTHTQHTYFYCIT